MRHELKYIITQVQYHILRGRLKSLLPMDSHAGKDGHYFIRSIYFDSPDLMALSEKVSGVLEREKYRIRYYNGNPNSCSLECKIKKGTRIEKKSERIGVEQAERFFLGESSMEEMAAQGVYGELKRKMQSDGFRPWVTVDYLREAYVHPLSNLRVTFDKEIAAVGVENIWQKKRGISNVLQPGEIILEVKYDDVIPAHISETIASIRPVQVAASKYTMCAIAKQEGKIL